MFTYYRHRYRIACGHVKLNAELTIPVHARGIIIFTPEEAGICFGNRNRLLASHLHKQGFGTLFPELLTLEESKKIEKRFDMDLMTARLMTVTEWLRESDHFKHFKIGYFGTGIASIAVLQSAAYLSSDISAVVCRNLRPGFIPENLPRVEAPTLLIQDDSTTDAAKQTGSWFSTHLQQPVVAHS